MSSTSMQPPTVGIVGLGAMGGAFARQLLARGFDVVGHDLRPGPAADLREQGGRVAGSAAAVRETADVVLTSLPTAAALDAVMSELAGASGGADVVVETSTMALADKQRAREQLADAGIVLLDCPVAGSGEQAAVGDLIVLASGDAAALARVEPVLQGIGRGVHRLGAFGAGTRLKLISNQLVMVHTVAAAEAMRAVQLGGIEPAAAAAALADGSGSSRMLQLRAARMLTRSYESATRLEVLLKDVELIDAANAELGIEPELFAHSAAMLRRAGELGHGGSEPAVVFELYADDPPAS